MSIKFEFIIENIPDWHVREMCMQYLRGVVNRAIHVIRWTLIFEFSTTSRFVEYL